MYNEIKEQSLKANDCLGKNSSNESEPEFKILFYNLTKEISHNIELSDELFRYSDTLKPIYQPQKDDDLIEQNPRGIIEMFQSQIWKLGKSNAKLVEVCNHLRKLIGNS